MKISQLRENLSTGGLWFVPAIFVLASILLAFVTVAVDESLEGGTLPSITFDAGADSARSFLTTIASSMITFTGLVFSITIVVLQLASGQFSPRVLRTFLRDRQSQYSLGVFVATFTYALMVLREVGGPGEPGQANLVPSLSISIAFLLVLLSVGFFVSYIHHMAQAIRVSSIIASVGRETREVIEDIYDHDVVAPPALDQHPSGEPDGVVLCPGFGVLAALDRDGLVEQARKADCVLRNLRSIGDFIPEGAPLFEVYGNFDDLDHGEVIERVDLARERSMRQDPGFGFRQLVDIAEKALSPAINDPTTAVQVLDQIHDLLRRIVRRPFPTGERFDSEGRLRTLYPVATWEGYVHLTMDEIRHFGARSIQVVRRMRALLEDLLDIAPVERRAALEEQLALLDAAAARAYPDALDLDAARRADHQGIS
ncbi:DUF2254 domain-containing protein [soil metagenome]